MGTSSIYSDGKSVGGCDGTSIKASDGISVDNAGLGTLLCDEGRSIVGNSVGSSEKGSVGTSETSPDNSVGA